MFLPLFLTVLIVFVSVSGDKLLDYYKNPLVRALVDNATHGTIGLLTWSVVLSAFRDQRRFIVFSKTIDILFCGFIASAIDVDHFLHFKSESYKKALPVDKRGFLHCTTLWIAVCVSCFTISKVRPRSVFIP